VKTELYQNSALDVSSIPIPDNSASGKDTKENIPREPIMNNIS